MIIVSKFRDYYDSIAKQFRDDKVVYNRQTTPVEIQFESPEYKIHDKFVFMETDGMYGAYSGIDVVIFCGKIYPFYIKSESTYKDPFVDFFDPYSHLGELNYWIIH